MLEDSGLAATPTLNVVKIRFYTVTDMYQNKKAKIYTLFWWFW